MKSIRRFILAILISFSLAMLAAESGNHLLRKPPPIVFRLDALPQYGRKKPLKRHFVPAY